MTHKDLNFSTDWDSIINPLNANSTKWSNTLKQFVGNLPTNCLSVFDHFVGLALKGLTRTQIPTLLCRYCKTVILICSWKWKYRSFFLRCQSYLSFRTALMNELSSINCEIVSLRPTALLVVILYGDKSLMIN